ncbi:MAG: hypothetical protein GY906_19460 [bacterium]|nr:hypothetical protein [bacterium]
MNTSREIHATLVQLVTALLGDIETPEERLDSESLQLNLDAYRIIAEILRDLRQALRTDLERVHGSQWFRSGLSEDVFNRLIGRKERENAIDWHDREYQELLDFMGFSDLAEILDHNPDCLRFLATLAPSRSLLHARFLELEVIRRRLGMTRPISESQLSFLGNFHLRLHRAMTDHAGEEGEDEPRQSYDKRPVFEDTDEQEAIAVEVEEPEQAPAVSNVTPIRPDPPDSDEQEGADEEDPETPDEQPLSRRERLQASLGRGDRKAILTELYTEVTQLAEGLWSRSGGQGTPMWDDVCESTWYEDNFSNLGLKPLSDFYEIIAALGEHRSSGMSKNELQNFLKERNFAHVLLALRDMFQKNKL